MYANTIKGKQPSYKEPYNHFHSLLPSRHMFPWISLQVSQSQATNHSLWWLLIDFPNMLIFARYHTHLPQHWWLKFSWTKYSNCMACWLPFCLIETPLSSTNFGKNFLSYKACNSNWVQLIIPKPMVKQKKSTNVWRPIYGASLQTSNINGYNGCL